MSDQVNSLTLRAERTRNHLAELIDSLQQQLAPGELLQEFIGSPGGRDAADIGAAVVAQVKRNPLACLMIAAGVGWLIYSDQAQPAAGGPRKRGAPRARGKKRRAGRKKQA